VPVGMQVDVLLPVACLHSVLRHRWRWNPGDIRCSCCCTLSPALVRTALHRHPPRKRAG
jgi:hypothetical protein